MRELGARWEGPEGDEGAMGCLGTDTHGRGTGREPRDVLGTHQGPGPCPGLRSPAAGGTGGAGAAVAMGTRRAGACGRPGRAGGPAGGRRLPRAGGGSPGRAALTSGRPHLPLSEYGDSPAA